MKKVNALGKPCPLPVIETKKAIRELGDQGGTVEVLVDNEIAVQNIEKMASSQGFTYSHNQIGEEHFSLLLHIPEKQAVHEAGLTGLTIAVGRNTLGEGDPDLGQLLMKSYLHSLTELEEVPQHLFFFNSGAFLTTSGSDALKDLEELKAKGTSISTCGACLDFYHLKELLMIGEITNMYAIAEGMAQADKLINL